MYSYRASLVTRMVRNMPAMWETRVQSLGQEDPLKKKMAKAIVHGVTKSRTRLSGSHFSVYSCHLFLISSASVRSIPFVSFIVPICMKCSLGISNFLEEISSLSHSIVFLYFFALITKKDFLISPCYSLELCIQMGISFLFSFAFHFSSFSAICKASSDNHFAFLYFFSWEWSSSLPPVQCHEPPSIVLQALYQI